MNRVSAQAFVFLLGAVAGTLLDQIHVRSGVLWYAHPVLFGQAFWVPLVFGAGGLVLVNSHAVFVALAGGGVPGPLPRRRCSSSAPTS